MVQLCEVRYKKTWSIEVFAPHHREELQERLGGHGQVELSDDDLIERIREILDDLEGDGFREQ